MLSVFGMSGQNYAKIPFTVIASLECQDASMEGSDKRSLSESSSPAHDDILRAGPKHTRAYKSPFTVPAHPVSDFPIEAASRLPTIQSFPFKLSDMNDRGSNSQAVLVQVSASHLAPGESLKVIDSMV